MWQILWRAKRQGCFLSLFFAILVVTVEPRLQLCLFPTTPSVLLSPSLHLWTLRPSFWLFFVVLDHCRTRPIQPSAPLWSCLLYPLCVGPLSPIWTFCGPLSFPRVSRAKSGSGWAVSSLVGALEKQAGPHQHPKAFQLLFPKLALPKHEKDRDRDKGETTGTQGHWMTLERWMVHARLMSQHIHKETEEMDVSACWLGPQACHMVRPDHPVPSDPPECPRGTWADRKLVLSGSSLHLPCSCGLQTNRICK